MHGVHRYTGCQALSSRPHWVPHPPYPQGNVSLPPLGSKGGTHSLSWEGVGGPNSDEGTDTLLLLAQKLYWTKIVGLDWIRIAACWLSCGGHTVTRPYAGFPHQERMAPDSSVWGRENDCLIWVGNLLPQVPKFSCIFSSSGIFRRINLWKKWRVCAGWDRSHALQITSPRLNP